MAEVSVDDAAITKLGDMFLDFSKNIVTPALAGLPITVAPGAFADGDLLKTTVTLRSESLRKALTGVQKALTDIGNELHRVGQKYKDTATDTTVEAKEFDSLIDLIQKDLPGFLK